MELKDLIGKHYLSGVEYGSEKYKDSYSGYEDDRQYVMFVLDEITYLASEDPEDGYRSCCNELKITEKEVKNIFQSIEVLCKMRSDDNCEEYDVLEIYDINTSELVLAIGTGNINDYYPYFEFEYHPENMILNK